VPEFNDLFQAVAAGHDGAIGSRFSHQSVVLNYPFAKLVGNRAFHLLVRLFLRKRVRDVTNNLKLYRASILKELDIEQSDFAVNAETGLKPLLEGYDIVEVPISWINRTSEMGRSSFRLVDVSPSYFRTLMRLLRRSRPPRRT
jgi:dolichol-phosphate mannosyltransferase